MSERLAHVPFRVSPLKNRHIYRLKLKHSTKTVIITRRKAFSMYYMYMAGVFPAGDVRVFRHRVANKWRERRLNRKIWKCTPYLCIPRRDWARGVECSFEIVFLKLNSLSNDMFTIRHFTNLTSWGRYSPRKNGHVPNWYLCTKKIYLPRKNSNRMPTRV